VSFVQDDPEFGDLLRIVAGERRTAPGLIEKDYWVTHTLRALHDMGFDIWFKGGTSLSKGFRSETELKCRRRTVRNSPPDQSAVHNI
jgi:hypothetical protein